MKVSIFLLVLLFISTSIKAQNKSIVISAFKVVYVKVPIEFKIEEVQLGMEEKYFSSKIVKSNLCAVQANTNQNLPPSNISIVCSNGLFQADITVNHGTLKYFYEFSKDEVILFNEGKEFYKNDSNVVVSVEVGYKEPIKNKTLKTVENHDAKSTVGDWFDNIEFQKDRCLLGTINNQIGFYVNNIMSKGENIYISFKMKNFSNLAYHCEFLQTFLLTKQKKNIATISPDKEVLSYESLVFPKEIKPGASELFIIQFNNSFSLAKGNSIQLIMDEGEKGRRLIDYSLTQKSFFKHMINIE
ncbi:DUF4138 domain-containing protein [Chondrinema litorale]|uniref:DUF4138 domain-containing protein n=1 Tax=Chondrinema litorale TaxID=2994555 RepID=UPI0025432AF9|nr:DUF4138 domain-containing protein [Chondrinema litorale]UZR98990.1 DUF4138 domain-containing protein [Chondrinema litorale]